MERPLKGDVVVIPFPFSDLSGAKKRPALVAAKTAGEDIILCQITSEARQDDYAVPIAAQDFKDGKLPVSSFVRANKLFTAERSMVMYCAGSLKDAKMKEIENRIVELFRK